MQCWHLNVMQSNPISSYFALRTPTEPAPPPVREPIDPPEKPDVPVREPDPEDPRQI